MRDGRALKEWRTVTLSDVLELKYGKSLAAASRSGDGFPVYGSNGVVGAHKETVTQGPTIVVGRKGSYGQINYSSSRCWPIDTTYYVDETCTAADLRWLAHLLPTLGLDRMNKSAAIPGLSREDAYRVPILLPPLDEQRRIAAILDKADELRTKRRQALAHLDTLTQSIFHSMFGDPAKNDAGFEKKTIVELCSTSEDIRCGPFGTQLKKSEFTSDGVPLWGIRNVNKHFELPTEEFVSTATAQRLAVYDIRPADIVMTRKGTIGNCALYPDAFPVGIMHSDLLRVRVDPSRVSAKFLSEQLHHSRDVERQIDLISSGAIMAGINVGKLKSVQVVLPPLKLQQTFATRVAAVERLKLIHRKHLAELDALFASLQHRAFKGEL